MNAKDALARTASVAKMDVKLEDALAHASAALRPRLSSAALQDSVNVRDVNVMIANVVKKVAAKKRVPAHAHAARRHVDAQLDVRKTVNVANESL